MIPAVSCDLNENFIKTGQNPQNYILKNDMKFFPKIHSLNKSKNEQIEKQRLHQPFFLKADLETINLGEALQTQFESILIDPPWYEYFARSGGFPPTCNHQESTDPWTFEEIRALNIEDIAATPSFCFIWCGNKHVEQATACLIKWGFRRIENVCWIKTNTNTHPSHPDYLPYGSLTVLRNTKETLLVGVRGSVQRSRDGYLMHANLDSDVVIAPEEECFGCMKKPESVYGLIERFCNSSRRIELFGHSHNLRPGWVTVGDSFELSNFDPNEYWSLTDGENRFVKSTPEIERLRPKSPTSRQKSESPPPTLSL